MWVYNDEDGNCLECGGKGVAVWTYTYEEYLCPLCHGAGTCSYVGQRRAADYTERRARRLHPGAGEQRGEGPYAEAG